jgi:hypothetical protein
MYIVSNSDIHKIVKFMRRYKFKKNIDIPSPVQCSKDILYYSIIIIIIIIKLQLSNFCTLLWYFVM